MRPSRCCTVLAIVLLAGCATQKIRLEPAEPVVRAQVAPPTQELRAGLGRIAVVAVRPSTGPNASGLPGVSTGAGAGAAIGAITPVAISDGYGIVLMPLGALVGAIVGAATSHSEAEISQAQRSIAAALTETDVTGRIRADMVATAPHGATLEAVDTAMPTGFDQVLEVEVRSIGFTSSSGDFSYDPDVTTWVIARTRVRRTTDDACLYERLWLYRSPEQAYFTLAAANAQVMRTELQTAAVRLAARMADDLFVATQPTASQPPEAGRAGAMVAPNYASGCPSGSTPLKED